MEYVEYFGYNSLVILSFFFICLIVLILNYITKGKSNKLLFSSCRGSVFNPFTYVRMFTHVLGHDGFNHFRNNFLYILLIGPMIEEKYGSYNLIVMILITAFVTALINIIMGNKRILGASGIAFMLILLSSLVNLESGKIPVTFILIFLFYIFGEIKDCVNNKRDKISHMSHLVGAICGFIYGFYVF